MNSSIFLDRILARIIDPAVHQYFQWQLHPFHPCITNLSHQQPRRPRLPLRHLLWPLLPRPPIASAALWNPQPISLLFRPSWTFLQLITNHRNYPLYLSPPHHHKDHNSPFASSISLHTSRLEDRKQTKEHHTFNNILYIIHAIPRCRAEKQEKINIIIYPVHCCFRKIPSCELIVHYQGNPFLQTGPQPPTR